MANFAGNWIITKTENMDEFLDALSVPEFIRKMAADKLKNHSFEIIINGNIWTYKGNDGIDHQFELGKEFELLTPDGSKMKGVTNLEESKMISVQTDTGKVVRTERYFDGDKLIVTLKYGDTVARHEYVRA